jgi:hypothetical protein
MFESRRRRADRLRDNLDRVPASPEIIEHARAAVLTRVRALVEGRQPPPLDAAAVEVLRADARHRGASPPDRAELVDRIWTLLGHGPECGDSCTADHRPSDSSGRSRPEPNR